MMTAPLAHCLPDRSVALVDGTLGDALRRTAARFPDRPALAWADGEKLASMTHAQLLAHAGQVAFWLLDHAQPGARIGIWSRNSVEWVLLELGIALAGMVVASWNPGWTDFECRHADDLSEPSLVFVGEDTRGHPLAERARAIAGEGRTYPLADLIALAAAAAPRALPQVSPDDLFLIQFTSGTTGRAKGAALSHRNAVNGAWLRLYALGADETDVWVNPSPLNHMGGAISMLPGAVLSGSCYVVMNRFDAGEYLRLMRLSGATRIGGVPTVLVGILEHPDWKPGEVRLRSIGSGGAQVPQPLIERLMREFDCPVFVAYAQSECPMISSSMAGDPAQLLAETCGKPLPQVELKIVDPASGATLACGETGEVCVRSPVTMIGYYRQPEATATTIDGEGFLHTGDLGTLDAGGYLRIQGRKRDVIIRAGENIYPAEVEDALLTHAGIEQAAVVGYPDARWGQQVAAAVRPRAGAVLDPADLEKHAARRLAHFKVPRRWLFVDSFPLTPNGKIAKVEVEKLFLES